MSLLSFWRSKPAPLNHSHTQSARNASAQQYTLRRQVLQTALRDTLIRYHIPSSGVGCETLLSSRNSIAPTVHVRLLVKDFEPRLLTQAYAFQKAFLKRATSFDPKVVDWLSGVSWQFETPGDSLFSEMPVILRPQMADAMPAAGHAQTAAAEAASEAIAAAAGPTEQESLAELHRLFMAADVERALISQHVSGSGDFQPTQSFDS
jgi:hypothetical protein